MVRGGLPDPWVVRECCRCTSAYVDTKNEGDGRCWDCRTVRRADSILAIAALVVIVAVAVLISVVLR